MKFYETKKRDLALLVHDRNELIHHLLPKFNPDSIESCIEVDQLLEQQCEKFLAEYNYITSICMQFYKSKITMSQFMATDVGKVMLLSSGLEYRIINLLNEISSQKSRDDGWTFLNTAGSHAPEELAELKDKLGHKTLKAMILATVFLKCVKSLQKKVTFAYLIETSHLL